MGYVGNAPYNGIVNEGNIADNAVTTSKIAPDTVVAADIAAGAVGLSELSATGTPSSSTYLRGDNSWTAVPAATPGGSTTQVQYNNAGAFGGDSGFVYSGGNVGIGTSSPGASYKLDVTGNTRTTGYCSINDVGYIRSSAGLLEFQGGSTATRFMNAGYGAELMRVTQAGDVGIGTTIPNSKLDVANLGTSTSVAMRLSSNDSGGNSLRTVLTQNADGSFTVNSNQGGNGSARDIIFQQASSERLRIGNAGQIGIGGANYGTSGQVLTSNGSGAAPSWQSGGKVLQVKQSVISSALTQTGGNWSTWVDLSGYSFTITPSSATSKILYQISFGAMTQSTNAIVFRLVRNGTIIGVGDASGSRPQATFRNMREGDANHTRTAPHFTYLDSPGTTSSVEYKLQWTGEGSPTIYINRAQNDTDGQSYGARTISTITLWEIAA